jgi:hypothetical protein
MYFGINVSVAVFSELFMSLEVMYFWWFVFMNKNVARACELFSMWILCLKTNSCIDDSNNFPLKI